MATQIRRAVIMCRMVLPVVHIKGTLGITIGACVRARAREIEIERERERLSEQSTSG
jgi:hypothetical protein